MIKQYVYAFLALLFLSTLSSCWSIEVGQRFEHIAPGPWLGVFGFSTEIPSKIMEEKRDSIIRDKVPVEFLVNSDSAGVPKNFQFISGSDTITSDSLKFWGDSVFVYFLAAKTNLRVVFEVDNMQGYLYDMEEIEYPVQFKAKAGKYARFPDIRRAPISDITGNWDLLIANNETENTHEGQIDFRVATNTLYAKLHASELNKETHLEGTIQGKYIYLSGFDGKTVIFLSGEISEDGKSLVKTSLRVSDNVYDLKGNKM